MPTRTQTIRHTFGGGVATDFGPSIDAVPDQSGALVIPFLIDGDNVVLELDGGPQKIGGTSKLNTTTLESGVACDYWRQGLGPPRRRVVHVSTKVLSDDGTFTTRCLPGWLRAR